MGWTEGRGLGKSLQGRTDIIETEQRVSNAGLGSKNASLGVAGDDYKSYIKKMMKKRYEEVQ
jgi:RNA-binding protein 5/10